MQKWEAAALLNGGLLDRRIGRCFYSLADQDDKDAGSAVTMTVSELDPENDDDDDDQDELISSSLDPREDTH